MYGFRAPPCRTNCIGGSSPPRRLVEPPRLSRRRTVYSVQRQKWMRMCACQECVRTSGAWNTVRFHLSLTLPGAACRWVAGAKYSEPRDEHVRTRNVDECLTKPCSLCSKRITGANWRCSGCGACICFLCVLNLNAYPPTCPRCGAKLI
jgi:hypothetical protein